MRHFASPLTMMGYGARARNPPYACWRMTTLDYHRRLGSIANFSVHIVPVTACHRRPKKMPDIFKKIFADGMDAKANPNA